MERFQIGLQKHRHQLMQQRYLQQNCRLLPLLQDQRFSRIPRFAAELHNREVIYRSAKVCFSPSILNCETAFPSSYGAKSTISYANNRIKISVNVLRYLNPTIPINRETCVKWMRNINIFSGCAIFKIAISYDGDHQIDRPT